MSVSAVCNKNIHTSVLREESAEILNIDSAHRYVDATLGLGGHTYYFCEKNTSLRVMGFDQDTFAREKAAQRLQLFGSRVRIIPENFETIEKICRENNFFPDSILFDIGVSSLQFDTPERGFSFRFDAPLDMRMDISSALTAEKIINTWSEEELEKIFLEYGEESWGRHIAKKICEQRLIQPFTTTLELSDFIARIKPFQKKTKKTGGKNSGGHPAVLVFQALRIAVNRELEVLEIALHSALRILQPGGRLAVITFHSLEDRIVKNIFASYEKKGKKQKYPQKKIFSPSPSPFYLEKIYKKPLLPSEKEIHENPRARSAKLRAVEKKLFSNYL